MEPCNENGEAKTGFYFPLRRRLTLILLFFSLLLMFFGMATSPTDEPYYYVTFWTLSVGILLLSIMVGVYDIVKTYAETRFLYEKLNQDHFQVDVDK
ncbi:MAG: hypothetical protein LBQ50_08700 [Planctomycetaceae bacterium]|jgi:hypothetical protein|nr:hypothetical protein [Planctomycetaceae bacterium]